MLGGAAAGAQTRILTLVDNTAEDDGTPTVDLSQDRAMLFFTGTDHIHYWLNSVELDMEVSSGSESTYTVKLYSESGNFPDTELATLTNPASLRTGLNRFTLPGGYRLAADTGYYVVVSATTGGGDDPQLRMTASGEQAGEEGWAIAVAYSRKNRDATNWLIVSGQTPQFSVKGSLGPAAPITLVDNTDKDYFDEVNLSEDRAVLLAAGSSARLSSVEVDMLITDPSQTYPTYTVKLYSHNAGPSSALATFTNPPSLSTGLNRFTLPGGYLLAADTLYWLVISISIDGTIGMRLSMTDDFDQSGVAGWDIGNGHRHKTRSATSWASDSNQTLQLRVHGFTDVTAPVLQRAEVFFDTLTLTFNEPLDETSVPSLGSFQVNGVPAAPETVSFPIELDGPGTPATDTEATPPSAVDVSGNTVTLTLPRAVKHGTPVTVSYTPPAAKPLRDYPGNQVARFENQRVTNNTPDIETGVIYEAVPPEGIYRVEHRVVRDANGHCYREELRDHGTWGYLWQRSESYGNDDEACRKASWHAYQASRGEELTPTDSDDFPTGQPPGLVAPRCPSGWVGNTGFGQQWCVHPDLDEALSPERAFEFVRRGLRPSDATSTNRGRYVAWHSFMDSPELCDEGHVIGFPDGGNGAAGCVPEADLVSCSSGNEAGISGRLCLPPQQKQYVDIDREGRADPRAQVNSTRSYTNADPNDRSTQEYGAPGCWASEWNDEKGGWVCTNTAEEQPQATIVHRGTDLYPHLTE